MRKRRNLGFTMAEMLIVVAIVAILGGVAFIAVQQHQRSLSQLERETIAKEIFIAAQNHLTMTESQGYLGQSAFGTEETDAEGKSTGQNVYYVIGPSSGNILDQILPFGSIDETIRAGGSYLIRYQSNPAQVLDVFYCSKTSSPAKYNHTIKESDYSKLMQYKENGYGGEGGVPSNGYLVGWYGGADPLANTQYGNYELLAPTVEAENKERLVVKVSEPNKDRTNPTENLSYTDIKLIIEGETSGAKASIKFADLSESNTQHPRYSYDTKNRKYVVVLDDITTAGLHFDELNIDTTIDFEKTVTGTGESATETTKLFIPGENITVQAVAYSNTALTNIAYSNAVTTNSLFADIDEAGETAMIGMMRHLENLDATISHLDNYDEDGALDITKATQIDDLNWNNFVDELGAAPNQGDAKIVKILPIDLTDETIPDGYWPVYPSHWKGETKQEITKYSASDIALAYDGKAEITTITKQKDPNDANKEIEVPTTTSVNHSITGVHVNDAVNAGLFGSLIDNSRVSNLELIDFSISAIDEMNGQAVKTSGNAGALVGTLKGSSSTITNVLARNSTDATIANITAATGSAGGLIGKMEGGTIQKSAAALIVSATGGNAGGLIGTALDGTVNGCYAGGHTIDDPKGSGAVIYSDEKLNVTATAGYAGGLIGDAGKVAISNSYSTCSTAGKYAGGFVGKGDTGGSATNSYATGLVLGGDTTTKTIMGEDGQTTKETTFTEIQAQEGAFAYSFAGTATNCKIFEIVNEREEKDATGALTGGYTYLLPVPDDTTGVIKALDENAEEYNNFCGASTEWKPAKPYTGQTKLESYYGGKYNLKSIEQLAGTLKVDDNDTTEYFVATHYGDWPAPEIFVVNTKSSN